MYVHTIALYAHADAYRTYSALSHANSALSACRGSQARTMPVACTDRQVDSWIVKANVHVDPNAGRGVGADTGRELNRSSLFQLAKSSGCRCRRGYYSW